MSDHYDPSEGVSFNGVHSFREWGLLLKERPKIEPPKPKTTIVNVPCANGELDLSTALTDGDIKFDNRDITIAFVKFGGVESWDSLFSNIQNYLHGKDMEIVFDTDKSYFYTGRVKVDSIKCDGFKAIITIKGSVYPYKKDRQNSTGQWLWDTFNFETGVIRSYGSMTVNGIKELTLLGLREMVVPVFTIETQGEITVKVEWEGETTIKQFKSGTYEDYDLRMREGRNKITLTGTGTVTVDYRGGSL